MLALKRLKIDILDIDISDFNVSEGIESPSYRVFINCESCDIPISVINFQSNPVLCLRVIWCIYHV